MEKVSEKIGLNENDYCGEFEVTGSSTGAATKEVAIKDAKSDAKADAEAFCATNSGCTHAHFEGYKSIKIENEAGNTYGCKIIAKYECKATV